VAVDALGEEHGLQPFGANAREMTARVRDPGGNVIGLVRNLIDREDQRARPARNTPVERLKEHKR
jgi:hypothetical protein